MNFYKSIRDDFENVRKQLTTLEQVYQQNQVQFETLKKRNQTEKVINKNEVLYYRLRNMFNGKVDHEFSDAVLYYFINKTSYCGMSRFNKNGEYNVPFGRYKNFNTRPINTQASNLLRSTKITNTDYSEVFNKTSIEDFMFLDPPYDCVFNEYGNVKQNGFGEEEHIRLAQDFKNLTCRALMIIGKTPLIEDLYKPYIKSEYQKNYAVNIRNRFKSNATHLIITNY